MLDFFSFMSQFIIVKEKQKSYLKEVMGQPYQNLIMGWKVFSIMTSQTTTLWILSFVWLPLTVDRNSLFSSIGFKDFYPKTYGNPSIP